MNSLLNSCKEISLLKVNMRHFHWPIDCVRLCFTPENIRERLTKRDTVKEPLSRRRDGILSLSHYHWDPLGLLRKSRRTNTSHKELHFPVFPVDLQSVFVSGPAHSLNANGCKKDKVPRLKWPHCQPQWDSQRREHSWNAGSWLTLCHQPLESVYHRQAPVSS